MTTSEERRAPACVLVIFGASGDLTARKLLPALERLAAYGALPPEVALVGVARTVMTDEEFGAYCREKVPGTDNPRWADLVSRARYVHGGYDDPATYTRLAEVLGECDRTHGTAANRVYYLATPPRLFGPIALSLGKAGLGTPAGDAFVRAVIEKPFGWDEDSARELYADLTSAFTEEQIFRIDHYLAKETVQNLLALRFANSIFEPIWNRTWVDNVQITVAETLGVGERGGFYETTGAMRDIVQNHVLQVLSLFLMEPPTSFHPEAIRDEKVKLLRAIRPVDGERDIATNAVRGQYTRGGTRADLMPGYREEPGVDPLSSTETFVAMRLDIDNWRWTGVPVYVRTGKRLPARVTEVAMQFHRPPHLPLFPGTAADLEPDTLVVRVQPDEGLSLRFGAKVPGHAFRVQKASMDFSYQSFEEQSPDAYERVILDALVGDPTLFIRADEVGRSWHIVDPVLRYWAADPRPIPLYQAATWGPPEATALITRDGRSWRHST
ncbi:glucose-6-phosphate 1-dehydrogenase [Geodermatophilus siccatus]|uniref:Glucose-6-phosphate 1-dehydrogenase n=1 Tax=Geodermatophilus siccatus TaxID=1137991 RepID=A0A1G9RIE7_9ACTN|nr:glucose-6-phosphate dehydrogenase [Geodermatophilus siccatus]SDM23092.1 glucose-6-phosphate 1-dehydrogenase [Geodermatophilus siccatus]